MKHLCLILFSIICSAKISQAQFYVYESWSGRDLFTVRIIPNHDIWSNNTGRVVHACMFMEKKDGTWHNVNSSVYNWKPGESEYDKVKFTPENYYDDFNIDKYVVYYEYYTGNDNRSYDCPSENDVNVKYAKAKKHYWGFLVAKDLNSLRSIVSKPFSFDADDAPLLIEQWKRYVKNLIDDNPELGRDYFDEKLHKGYETTRAYQSASYIMELHDGYERRGVGGGLKIQNETTSLEQYDYYIKTHTYVKNNTGLKIKKDNVIIAADFVYRKD